MFTPGRLSAFIFIPVRLAEDCADYQTRRINAKNEAMLSEQIRQRSYGWPYFLSLFSVYVSGVLHAFSVHGGLKRASDPRGLELKTHVNHHVHAWDQTQVLRRSNQ